MRAALARPHERTRSLDPVALFTSSRKTTLRGRARTPAATCAWAARITPAAAASHHRGSRVRQACQAPSTPSAAPGSMKVGFQMKVEKKTMSAEVATINATINPVVRPPIDLATHHSMGTTVTLTAAISPRISRGSPCPSHAAGISRS